MLLWLPDRRRKHPQRDVLAPHRHVRQGPHKEDAFPVSDRDRPLCPAESTVGAQMVQLHYSQLCRTHDRVCRSRRHILFGLFLCHLLVEKAWPDARLCFSNELISRNEGLHCNFACLLYTKLINKLPESRIVEIVSSAVKIEMEFVIDALPVELIGMNLGMMCNYIRFCADQLLLSLGCGRHYKIGNPFEWMEMISLQGKTNFFEKRVGEYSKSGVDIDRADQSFALDASF